MTRVLNRWPLAFLVLIGFLSVAGWRLNMARAQQNPGVQPRPGGQLRQPVQQQQFLNTMQRFSGMAPGAMGSAASPDPAAEAEREALAEQEADTQSLISEYGQTEDEKERSWVVGELTKVVAKHFDIRQESRDRELKRLEEQVRKLRGLHQKRAKQKDQIVQDRVRQLLRDTDGLGWGNDEGAQPGTPKFDGFGNNPLRPSTKKGVQGF